ncbi:pentatricopeptide repeat-containing protein At1g06140, mitochondrial-like [Arachis hypogaea]|uniref:pentatricopeptide repeat-containing protein At1g06140, mitochondrial-like n=1 Tax=Arachis hypogaea TaxID=3818 RepID=UPI000DED1985|nr:pentatricopeptide repeat-containing protein At1g06140, mitochondrial-like [Arachis hypogaea]
MTKREHIDNASIAYLNGVCHWWGSEYATNGLEEEQVLVSFNLSTETFQTTSIVWLQENDDSPIRSLVVLNKSVTLIFSFTKNNRIEISILGEIGVKESWVKLFTLESFSSEFCCTMRMGDKLRSASLSSFRKPLYLGNLMIRDSTNNGFYTETLNIYTSMVSHTGGHGNTFTYPLLLKACANLGSMIHGTMIHGHILRLGFQDDLFSYLFKLHLLACCSDSDSDSFSFLWQGMLIHCCLIKLGLVYSQVTLANALMGMYVHFSQMEEARKVFDLMDEKSKISWTTIMGGYVKVGHVAKAYNLFNQMQHQSTGIDFIVFLILISGCIQVGDLLLASFVQAFVLKCGCDKEESIENLLITMYAKCSDLASARRIFDLIIKKSIFSWTSMIAGYAHSDHPLEALHLFRRLVRTDFRPDGPTVATVISACADIGSISIAQEMEYYISLNGLEFDLQVQTSLIHLYSKCGSIKKVQEVFEKVADKDLTVWSSMINSYAIHGMGKEAIDLFRKMTTTEGIIPDAIVYTSVLLACSHAGLVEDGLKYFLSMQKDFGITPKIEHCTCLVDLLGRVGALDLALDTI